MFHLPSGNFVNLNRASDFMIEEDTWLTQDDAKAVADALSAPILLAGFKGSDIKDAIADANRFLANLQPYQLISVDTQVSDNSLVIVVAYRALDF